MLLTQLQADSLIKIDKLYSGSDIFQFPALTKYKIQVPLISYDGKSNFVLDLWNTSFIIRTKGTFQTRYNKAIPLVRLDFGGPPHENPDGEKIECPHLHIFKEGFGMKFAKAIPREILFNQNDILSSLDSFMSFCNIVAKPTIVTTIV